MKAMKVLLRIVSVLYLVGLCALWASSYWPWQLYWLANLLQMVPLWTLFIPLVFLFIMALLLRENVSIVAHVLSAQIIIFCIMGFNVSFTRQAKDYLKPQGGIRVLTCNIDGKRDLRRLSNYVARTQPDIIAMQEVASETQSALSEIFTPDKWNISFTGGLGLVSRFKIINVETKDRKVLGGWGSFTTRYELKTPYGIIQFFNVHLETPRQGIEAMMSNGLGGLPEMERVTVLQDRESQIASQWIEKYKNVLIAGDFNMSIANPIYKRYWSLFTDAFSSGGVGFGYTKFTRWHGVRIDHILRDGNWKILSADVGPDVGSDHRPVIADLQFIGKGDNSVVSEVQRHENALKVEPKPGLDFASFEIQLGEWNIDSYPIVNFSYNIPKGMLVEVSVKTTFNDWVRLDGSVTKMFIDDGKWHEVRINIKEEMHKILPNVKYLQEFKLLAPNKEGTANTFWIDEFAVRGLNKAE